MWTKVTYKNHKITGKLSKNTNIIILRQDKGRGVTILYRKDYIQKCFSILNGSESQSFNTGTTKSLERKVQRTLQKMKENEYKNL